MSTSTAIAVQASAQSAAASAQAARAERIACESMLTTVDPRTATVEVQQQYAHCVEVAHPSRMSEDGAYMLKGVILVWLILWVICTARLYREEGLGWGLFIGAIFAVGIAIVLFLFIAAITFLFS